MTKGKSAQAGSKPARRGPPGSGSETSLDPGLYVTATPIGNLGDITVRALDVLRRADAIACEDTRNTRHLLNRYGIATPLLSYHEHNAERARPQILARLAAGQAIALVSDAGTPLVSDPGFKLARAAIAAGHKVTALPGASAPLAALVVSGLPSDRFFFAGFLPPKGSSRRRALDALQAVPGTLIFLESPRRLGASLADLLAVFGPRPAAIARELTKLFEEVNRGDLASLAAAYAEAAPPKGEVVVLVGPAAPAPPGDDALDRRLIAALAQMPLKEAAVTVAAEAGISRREAYARALKIRAERDEGR